MLPSHPWLVTVDMDSTDLGHSHHCRKFYGIGPGLLVRQLFQLGFSQKQTGGKDSTMSSLFEKHRERHQGSDPEKGKQLITCLNA